MPRGPRDGDADRESGRQTFSLTERNKPKPKPRKKKKKTTSTDGE